MYCLLVVLDVSHLGESHGAACAHCQETERQGQGEPDDPAGHIDVSLERNL